MLDPVMRRALEPLLATRHYKALVVHEYGGLESVRADIAAFAEHEFHAYEIKSDHDSLRRLDTQLAGYARLFHRLSVATGPRYAAAVAERVPGWVELIVIDECGHVALQRPGELNPSHLQTARALWVEEGRTLCRQQGLQGYSRLRSWELPAFIHQQLSPEVVQAYVLACLQQRYAVRATLFPNCPPELT